jgi:outer membrane receptor protein involved in Fe transport
MKYFSLLFLANFICFNARSQVDNEPLPENGTPVTSTSSRKGIFGKIIDQRTKKPIHLASVRLVKSAKNDKNQTAQKEEVIAALLSKDNGDFYFENIRQSNDLEILVSVAGYKDFSKEIATDSYRSPNGVMYAEKDLGNIGMTALVKTLKPVTIYLENPALQLGIDKKIYNPAKSITSEGGTAMDVIKDIPSVSVDVDGNVELRNSTPTIFVDGRPTELTLDQIPADNIEKIELITNPSAKYDAATTGGIINIILKKNRRKGLNGIVSGSLGTQNILRGNGSLNLRQGKLNFFVSGNYFRYNGRSNGQSFRENKSNGIVENSFNQYSDQKHLRRFTSVRSGLDYFIDNRNTLSFSQNFLRGRFRTDEFQHQEYYDSANNLNNLGERISDSWFQFNRNTSELIFTHKYPRDGEKLDAGVNYSYGNVKNYSNITNETFFTNGMPDGDPDNVRSDGGDRNNQLTLNLDFTDPISKETKIEAGARSFINNYSSYFNSYAIYNGSETKLPLSNDYKYTEVIHALYFTYTGRLNKIGYQIGLRGEYSKFTGVLIDSSENFGYEYPSSLGTIWNGLFPSVYLSKKLNENEEIQLNYSRRIRRPRFWQLNPFININDPLNLQEGNPRIKPEFTNSIEFNFSKTFVNNSNLLAVLYYRNTTQDITRYSDTISAEQYQQLHNAAVDPNAILNTFINAASNNRIGVEIILQQKVNKNFDFTPSVNLNYSSVNAGAAQSNLSNSGFNWSGKLNANYKIETKHPSIFNKLSFQLNSDYRSPMVIPQGRRLARFDADFAIRKDLFADDKGSVIIGVNDIFNSRKFGVIYDTETFYQKSYRRRSIRTFRITFSYRFGNNDFTLNRKNKPASGDNFD